MIKAELNFDIIFLKFAKLTSNYITKLFTYARRKALFSVHKTLEMLTANLRHLELGDFCESNVFGRGKYAEFSELSLKICEIKIQSVI